MREIATVESISPLKGSCGRGRLCRLCPERVVRRQPIEYDGRGPGLLGGAERLAGERLEVLGEAAFCDYRRVRGKA